MKGLAGVVILFNPDEVVINNIASYAHVLEKLWIIDNSENDLKGLTHWFRGFTNAEILQDGFNKGIGARLNYALTEAGKSDFKWLLTMDQDSRFTSLNLEKYINTVSEIEKADSPVAQIGVEYSNKEEDKKVDIQLETVDMLITSGSFINLQKTQDIGLFNEELFIDEVDTEFSYRVALKGYKSLLCQGVFMVHQLGDTKLARSLKSGKKTERFFHSSTRLYYMTRNYLYIRKKFKDKFPENIKKKDIVMLHIFKNNLLYNKSRFQSIRMIIRGYLDYVHNRFGRLEIS